VPDQRFPTDHPAATEPGSHLLEGATATLRSPELADLVSAVIEGRPATWPATARVSITYAEPNKTREETSVQ
jgi:hypothetical protein